jgi:hypothetical protein
MQIATRIVGCLLLGSSLAVQAADPSPAPVDAAVYFISPQHGERVTSPVTVRFGLRGMGIAPAGIALPHTGHHHLLIDLPGLPALDKPIPADAQHVHFGKGQTEVTLELSPGKHTLQLLLADHLHTPHVPPVASSRIEIEVLAGTTD